MPVKIIAFVTVTPGKDDAFVDAARPCITASRAEAGVLHYDLWREVDGERRFVFNELYVDDAAVQAQEHPTTSRRSASRHAIWRRHGRTSR